jgi:LacI family transcriptional regulator
MAEVLERHRPPLSLFVVNDDTALGVLRFCTAHKLRIPEDIALIGFSDIETLNDLNIPLSTVRIPAEAMGERAATMLIENIRNGDLPLPERVELPVELVVRGSAMLSNKPRTRNPAR